MMCRCGRSLTCLREYISRQGWDLVAVYIDEVSALEDAPNQSALQLRLRSVEGEFDFLVVSGPSGLHKNRQFLAGLRETLGEQGVEVVSVTESDTRSFFRASFRRHAGEEGQRRDGTDAVSQADEGPSESSGLAESRATAVQRAMDVIEAYHLEHLRREASDAARRGWETRRRRHGK